MITYLKHPSCRPSGSPTAVNYALSIYYALNAVSASRIPEATFPAPTWAGSVRWLSAGLRDAASRSHHGHRRAAYEVSGCQSVTGARDVNYTTGDHLQ